MKYATGTRKDHQKFCLTEGWVRRKAATGKSGTHHENYEFGLPDGRILWTRISRPVNRVDYGKRIWAHILRDQLEVEPPVFWACVGNGLAPDRGGVAPPPPEAIPLGIVIVLVEQLGVSEADVRAMTKEQAIARMIAGYSALPPPD